MHDFHFTGADRFRQRKHSSRRSRWSPGPPCQPSAGCAYEKALPEKTSVYDAETNQGITQSVKGSFVSIRAYDCCIFRDYTANRILSVTCTFINPCRNHSRTLQNLSRSALSVRCAGRHGARHFSRTAVMYGHIKRFFQIDKNNHQEGNDENRDFHRHIYARCQRLRQDFKKYTDYLEARGIPFKVFAPESTHETQFSSSIRRFTSLPFFLYPECRLALPNLLKMKSELHTFHPDLIHIATPFNIGLAGLKYAKNRTSPS